MIKREIEKRLNESLKNKEITILIGPRQIGKTTVLQKIETEFRRKGAQVLFFNLDIESDAKFFESQETLLNRIQLEFGTNEGYVFIDEIQQKENAGRFMKGLYDMNLPYKFVVTGSGSLELKEKIGEALTGRKELIEMRPISFFEFVDYRTQYRYTNRLIQYCQLEQDKLELFLNEYITFGGYPKVVISDSIQRKKEVMNEIFTSYIMKDITALLRVRTPDKFTKMIQLLAVLDGQLLNYSQLALEVGVSLDTLKNYLWYAQQTFVIELVKPYFTNAKKELTKSPTIYFHDLGMCNFGRGRYGQPSAKSEGFLFQNFVFQLLMKKNTSQAQKVHYWRTKDKAEVDFVIYSEGENLPVEVKFSKLKQKTLSRSFRSFINKYQPTKAFVINLSLDSQVKIGKTTVEFTPYWKLI